LPLKDKTKDKERNIIFLDAAKWANQQIIILKRIGVKKSKKEWNELRRVLIKSRLSIKTIETLQTDTE
jgi:hypothetical protein